MVSVPDIGLITWFVALLYGLGGVWGLPPGERDTGLIRSAPADTIVYAEWAERAPIRKGGTEFEGLIGDVEFQEFVKRTENGLSVIVEDNMESSANGHFKPEMIREFFQLLWSRPGCVFINYDVNRVNQARKEASQKGGTLTQSQAIGAGLNGVVLVNFGEGMDAFEKGILEFLKMIRGRRFQKPETLSKVDILELRTPFPLVAHRHDKYLILSTNEGMIEPLVERLKGKEKLLEKNPRYQKGVEQVTQERMGAHLWLDVHKGMELAATQFGLQGAVVRGMATITGLDQIESISSSTGLKEGQVVNRMFVDQGGKKERLWSLFAADGLTAKNFETIPSNAQMVLGVSIDGARVLKETRTIIKSLEGLNAIPRSKKDPLGDLDEQLGFSIEQDLLPALGSCWTIYDAPETGGLLATGLVAQVEIRDGQRAKRMFTQIVQLIRTKLPPFDERSNGANLAEGEFLGERIHFLNLMLLKPQPWAPAFCLTEKHLIVAIHPQALKAHLRFLKDSKAERFSSKLSGETPAVKVPAGDLVCLNYLDLQSLGRVFVPALPYLGELGAAQFQRGNIDVDALSIPSPAAILPYLKSQVSLLVRTEGGLVSEARGSLPPGPIGWGYWVIPLGLMEIAREELGLR
ncbi:MAG: DUF3352 domain-containing protein [Planctomycetales bacterium]